MVVGNRICFTEKLSNGVFYERLCECQKYSTNLTKYFKFIILKFAVHSSSSHHDFTVPTFGQPFFSHNFAVTEKRWVIQYAHQQETEGFSCRTLDSFIPINALVRDAMGSYVYKTDPSAAAAFTWRDPVNNMAILKFNIGRITGVNDVNLCLKKCIANPYCMSIEFVVFESKPKTCLMNGISSKAAGSAYQNYTFAKFQEKTCIG
ncbi:hypothetical protein CAPTEDRAFT_189192 [Capitella teleta]|uniref:Apple domain-containing protein n=1 Tax=Capitella teleta TaxID=283909 RepID=R7UWH4_CAPTE|nr:hypothetical protein CAPTEDRAFT_189192 [Capitella teleta]|eukprot:ELU08287.1 hypothetical protein CAPTEDRAFT_189192 [Capitella teleta]